MTETLGDTRCLVESGRSSSTTRICVVVPTYNEAPNIPGLLARIQEARQQLAFDVLVVDDNSPDGTGELIKAAQGSRPWLHLLERDRPMGLGSAYRAGFAWALAEGYGEIGEMDADLSHDPIMVKDLHGALAQGSDVALGSRYITGGGTEGWPLQRRLLSKGANLFARSVLRLPVRDVTGGFRLYKRRAAEYLMRSLPQCDGYGFQVECVHMLLDGGHRVEEVPITFRERRYGQSKMSASTAVEGARRCLSLAIQKLQRRGHRDSPRSPAHSRFMRLVGFGVVGLTGLAVNQAVLWIATAGFGVWYLWSAIIATQVSSTWNFAFNEWQVFKAGAQGRGTRLFWFTLLNNSWLLLRVPFLVVLTEWVGINYFWSNLIALLASTLVRFAAADSYIWASGDGNIDKRNQKRTPLCYNIHGIVLITSGARLPELEEFRVDALHREPDLEIQISGKGFGGLRRHVHVGTDASSSSYIEHLGRFGFAMRVEPGEKWKVQAGPLLRYSPHVLYTNVVEPVLRWLLVTKGCALVHGACLEIDGAGVLITARTDTGKTTTCLRSIRTHGSRFVSDDMVIVGGSGVVYSYPKPLTISAHTLKAAMAAPLPLWRKLFLQIQGRLHSKSGRTVGLSLGQWNLPVATMNALVQMLVPPPKYFVQQLIREVRTVSSLRLRHMVVIEVGRQLEAPLGLQEACEVLAMTTEDAYGFPPYPLLAEAISHGRDGQEKALHRRLLEGVAVTRVRTPARTWHERLPVLVQNGVASVNGRGIHILSEGASEKQLVAESTNGHDLVLGFAKERNGQDVAVRLGEQEREEMVEAAVDSTNSDVLLDISVPDNGSRIVEQEEQ
jgi:dolichol-phosphate mannosyltransferase